MTANRSASSSCSWGRRSGADASARHGRRPRGASGSRRPTRTCASGRQRAGAAAPRPGSARRERGGAPLSPPAPVVAATRPCRRASVSRVSASSEIGAPLQPPAQHARKACERSSSARPPFVIVHLTVPLERSRSRERRARPGRAGSGRPPQGCADARPPREQRPRHLGAALPERGQRPVDGSRCGRSACSWSSARACELHLGAPQPRCRNAASLAGAATQRIAEVSASGGGSSANTCVKRSAAPGRASSARVVARAPAQRAVARALDGVPAAPRRQAHPRPRPKRSRRQLALEQRRAGATRRRTRRAAARRSTAGRRARRAAPSPRRSTTGRSAPAAHTRRPRLGRS